MKSKDLWKVSGHHSSSHCLSPHWISVKVSTVQHLVIPMSITFMRSLTKIFTSIRSEVRTEIHSQAERSENPLVLLQWLGWICAFRWELQFNWTQQRTHFLQHLYGMFETDCKYGHNVHQLPLFSEFSLTSQADKLKREADLHLYHLRKWTPWEFVTQHWLSQFMDRFSLCQCENALVEKEQWGQSSSLTSSTSNIRCSHSHARGPSWSLCEDVYAHVVCIPRRTSVFTDLPSRGSVGLVVGLSMVIEQRNCVKRKPFVVQQNATHFVSAQVLSSG